MLFGEGPQIKNIAADLNKLFRQGSLLNQIGQTIEGDSTADQGTSDLLAARDPVIQEISVGMSGEQSARYTVSGTPPLSLTNSLGKPLKAWSVEVSPYQEGTGDPSPDNVRPIHGTDKLNLFVEESYDPTATPKAVITLPQTVYTGTIGSEGGENGSAVIILNGTQSINNQKYDGAENIVARWDLPSGKGAKSTTTGSLPPALCETMKPVSNTMIGNFNSWTSRADFAYSYTIAAEGNRVGIALPQSLGITNSTQLNAYLAANPIKVVYDVATQTEFAVTAPTIPTPKGTATTWATAEDGTVESMEVTYVGKA